MVGAAGAVRGIGPRSRHAQLLGALVTELHHPAVRGHDPVEMERRCGDRRDGDHGLRAGGAGVIRIVDPAAEDILRSVSCCYAERAPVRVARPADTSAVGGELHLHLPVRKVAAKHADAAVRHEHEVPAVARDAEMVDVRGKIVASYIHRLRDTSYEPRLDIYRHVCERIDAAGHVDRGCGRADGVAVDAPP